MSLHAVTIAIGVLLFWCGELALAAFAVGGGAVCLWLEIVGPRGR